MPNRLRFSFRGHQNFRESFKKTDFQNEQRDNLDPSKDLEIKV